jgi:predicted ester cyclase
MHAGRQSFIVAVSGPPPVASYTEERSMKSDVTVRRLNDAIQALDRATFDEYLHPACRLFCNGEEEACTADGYWEVVEAFRIGFPDLDHSTLELIDAGNRVTELFQVTGTHLGLFQGVAPTGRRVSFTGTAVFTIDHDRVVEDRTTVDLLSLLQQIGAIPAHEHADA